MDKFIKGELVWIKVHKDRPEEYEGKKTWSVTVYPDKESLEEVREMQGIGIKNKLKKDDKGWFVKFSRPVEDTDKRTGKVKKVYEPPVVTSPDGTVVDGFVNNGAIGTVKLDFTEGTSTKGKYYTARLNSIKLQDYKLWEGTETKKAPEVKQENYF